MGSRQKLNRLHLMGNIVLAGLAGVVVDSWSVFLLSLVGLVALDLHGGAIRPINRWHHGHSERISRSQRRRHEQS